MNGHLDKTMQTLRESAQSVSHLIGINPARLITKSQNESSGTNSSIVVAHDIAALLSSAPYLVQSPHNSIWDVDLFGNTVLPRDGASPLPQDRNTQSVSLFEGFDFAELESPDFKEDSVREEIIKPILDKLGYKASGKNKIQRSKKLRHPFVKIGVGKREITNYPDYLLSVDGKNAWVLDAKAPDEEILTGDNREQAFFYAIHPQINVKHYALCNGKEFVLFAINEDEPVVHFHISEYQKHWQSLQSFLSPKAFGSRPAKAKRLFEEFDYLSAKLLPEIAAKKQAAKRHYGVHGYFTRQAWNLVQEYIKNFTQPGDVVLDQFGGYGVTFLESMMLGRKAIHIDLNPLSVFILKGLTAPVDFGDLQAAYERVMAEFEKNCPRNEHQVKRALETLPYPKNIQLPRNADVRTIQELFFPTQLAQLAYLKSLILKIKNENIRASLMLCFSSSLNKFNKTFHYTKSIGGGDSGMFRYYRYRVAPEPGQNSLSSIFRTKFVKLIAAKKEIAPLITEEALQSCAIYKSNAADISRVPSESVDYIYTDPPYGAKIPYLDLSTMWTAWLDLEVTEEDFQAEAIEGGERKKSKSDYTQLITESLQEAYRVLKFDRWMSFVFQHKDPSYWHLIVETAQKFGFEYVGTVPQRVGQHTFKKRQHPFTVLHGQLIINFRKTKAPQAWIKGQLGYEISQVVMQTIEAVIARKQGATLEEIYNDLIVRGLEWGFLHEISKDSHKIDALVRENFEYDEKKHIYRIRKNAKFKTEIPLASRIRYYLVSYLRQAKRQDIAPTFDDIILNVMPLLKNGITPERQSILSVLKKIAQHVGNGRWQLVEDQQLTLPLEPPRKVVESIGHAHEVRKKQ